MWTGAPDAESGVQKEGTEALGEVTEAQGEVTEAQGEVTEAQEGVGTGALVVRTEVQREEETGAPVGEVQ